MLKESIIWAFSGAATKIVALVAHLENLIRLRRKPNVMAGLSSGWFVVLCYALGKIELLKSTALNLQLNQIFGFIPVNKKGNIKTAAYIRGMIKGSFGDSKGLEKLLRSTISEREWQRFLEVNDVTLYCGVHNYSKNRFELIKMNDVSYEEMITYSVASANIPLYCDPIEINGDFYVDGGASEHNPLEKTLEALIGTHNITEVISVYAREEDPTVIPDYGFNGKYLGRNLSKLIDTQLTSMSLKNQKAEQRLQQLHRFDLTQIFSKSFIKGIYGVDKNQLNDTYLINKATPDNIYRNEQ